MILLGLKLFPTLKQQQQQQPFYGPLSGTTRYQKKHSPTHITKKINLLTHW